MVDSSQTPEFHKSVAPNLFDFATSELSQDAVLAWLFAWGAPAAAASDRALAAAGQMLIRECFLKHDLSAPVITSVEVATQVEHMDVLVDINQEYLLVIEDKVHIREAEGQLARYANNIRDKTSSKVLLIYIQTGEQDHYSAVEQAGFRVFHRRELLQVLEKARKHGCTNSILLDFYQHLRRRDEEVNKYHYAPAEDWTYLTWRGFFANVAGALTVEGWGSVPARWGSFEGMWWSSHPLAVPAAFRSTPDSQNAEVVPSAYLQLENHRLRFKLHCPPGGDCTSIRRFWNTALLRAAVDQNLHGFQPIPRRKGRYQTVAELDGDFRIWRSDGSLDLERTMGILREAQVVVELAVRYWNAEWTRLLG